MKRYLKNNKGFTLIEMLLVLSIVLLTSAMVFQVTFKVSEKRVVEQFFSQLILDIQTIQALAIEKESTIFIRFSDSNKYSAYFVLGGEKVFEKKLPENVELNIYSNLKIIHIYSNGDMKSFGTIMFYTPFGESHLIVNMQKGRMRLVEY